MKKLKMGMIGVGGIAQSRHIPAYLAIPEIVEITAVQDLDQTRAEEVAKKFHIPNVFANYEDLFEMVDAVTICTPNKFHAEIAIAALEAGVHVFCEKPMAISVSECEAMLAASQKANKILSIAYHYRFMETSRIAKQAMSKVGDPLVTRVQALRRRKVPGWGVFTNKELQGGGSLIDWGCHFLDLSLWLLNGPEPVEVMGTAYNKLSKIPSQINEWGTFNHEIFQVDDHVSAYIKFKDGSSMLFECSWAANIKEDITNISISGVDGGLNVFPLEIYRPEHGVFMTTTTEIEENPQDVDVLQARNFAESCLGEAELRCKPKESMKVTKLIEAIYRSSEKGSSIKLQ
ncbi:Gfo/Idh/MocA family protein [Oceanobacillus saliphilus]|uniref:Gfo/Idh/MocA family protein n=1 Tax=Oceanobacillus saliphilus TaxID=2925834 RepID=UPI00201E2DA9|nr:Gfo/Idh/MocA family oxidoreductase [Oceanobacillus saliphilus]